MSGKWHDDDRQARRRAPAARDCCTTGARISRAPRHRCNEAVAAPGDRLDAASLRSPAIEDAAKRRDLDGQIVVLDHRSRPDGGHDLVFRDEIAVGSDQHTEHVERSRADRDCYEHSAFIPPEQAAPVEAKAPEQENLAGGERPHVSSPYGRERGRR